MHTSSLISALACLVGGISALGVPYGPNDPVITIINMGTKPHYYNAVKDSSASPTSWTGCADNCITVQPGKPFQLHPGVRWNGVITSQPQQVRHEINIDDRNTPGMFFYDISMQYGLGDSTLGPTDNSSPIAGEQDYLAKANVGWKTLGKAKQTELLAVSVNGAKYLTGTVGGSLTAARNDMSAPQNILNFYQITSQINAYIDPGSVTGKAATASTGTADKKSTSTKSNKFTIIGYH